MSAFLRPRRATALSSLLATLPLSALAALLILAAALLHILFDAGQAETRHDLRQSAIALAATVEQEIGGVGKRLEIIGRAIDDRRPDGPELEAILRRERDAAVDWTGLELRDAEGRVLASTDPVPAHGQASLPPHQREALATGRPALSDLHPDGPGGTPSVAVAVPLGESAGGGPPRVLSARLDPAALSGLLVAQQAREHGVVALFDRTHRLVARSRDIDRHIGKTAPDGIRRFLVTREAGIVDVAHTFDGHPSTGAWQRLPSGWTLTAAVPLSVYRGPLERSMAWLALGGVGALGLLMTLSLRLARRLGRLMRQAGEDARRVARGDPPPRRHSRIAELDDLNRALQEAGRQVASSLAAERAARAAAQAASRGKDEFMAMLGHELRNPLAAIANAIALLMHPDLPADQQARALSMLARQSGQMRRMLDDLLDMERLLHDKMPMARAPLDLAGIARQALDGLRVTGRLARHRVHADLDPAVVEGDAMRLEQLLVNLLDNAVRFTPAGGTIRVSTGLEAGEAVLQVEDDGNGIDADLLPHVFEPFVQGARTLDRAEGGLGIGLALTQRIALRHGGRLVAHSDGPGRGARFTLRLPAASSDTRAALS